MEKIKSLYDISLKITEEEYRADKALSYSTLSRYEREGFGKLDSLFESISTPSLTLGSAVDSIITGGQEEFNDRFIVAEFPKISDTLISIVRELFRMFSETHDNLVDIPDIEVSGRAKLLDFWAGDKWDKIRAKKVKEEIGCQEYYHLMFIAQGKTIISNDTYKDVCNMVNVLQNSNATRYYFAPNNPFENIERLYQLKFKATFDGVSYRNMADLIICDYDKKEITPIDLKTSGHAEYEFFHSFITYNYMIQARLYWRIIRDNMDRDPYFKDFKLNNYKFIVVNKRTLDPMVWEYPDTQAKGTLYYGKDKQIICRDPFEIGKELDYYLTLKPLRPIGISNENNLVTFLNKM